MVGEDHRATAAAAHGAGHRMRHAHGGATHIHHPLRRPTGEEKVSAPDTRVKQGCGGPPRQPAAVEHDETVVGRDVTGDRGESGRRAGVGGAETRDVECLRLAGGRDADEPGPGGGDQLTAMAAEDRGGHHGIPLQQRQVARHDARRAMAVHGQHGAGALVLAGDEQRAAEAAVAIERDPGDVVESARRGDLGEPPAVVDPVDDQRGVAHEGHIEIVLPEAAAGDSRRLLRRQ
jgi:hypothetical protein